MKIECPFCKSKSVKTVGEIAYRCLSCNKLWTLGDIRRIIAINQEIQEREPPKKLTGSELQ